VQHGGATADDDELDARLEECLDQRVEVSLCGMRHA